jgi:CBS domain-containing protein
MRKTLVRDVMTSDVITAGPDTPVKTITGMITTHDVGAVPIVDPDRRLLGVVSQEDLMPVADRRRRRNRALRRRAVDVMRRHPATIAADADVTEASRRMRDAEVGRLLVIDESGRLSGIVSRVDLLRLAARPDEAVRHDVAGMLRDELWLDPALVRATVDDGVVTLTGSVSRRSTAAIAVRRTGEVPGVLAVHNALRYDFDDDALARTRPGWLDLDARPAA